MITLFNEQLSKYLTFKIGGPAERLCIPQHRDELIELVKICVKQKMPYFILGRGSNVLVADKGLKKTVIVNTASCKEMSRENNIVTVGSSVSLQKLINFCVSQNLYGMEYLSSVPGTVGGAVYMNAGRGRGYKQSLADYIVTIEIFDGTNIRTLTKKDCYFAYRSSIFHKRKNWLILSVNLTLPEQDKSVGLKKIKERIEYVRKAQDLSYPNAGTIFKNHFKQFPELEGYRIGNARFSTKTPGWIINLGGATFTDVYHLIRHAKICHIKHFHRMPELELIIVK